MYNSDGELTAVSDDNSASQCAYNADGEETSQSDAGSPDLGPADGDINL
jgi:YD repeat-containing protein